MFGLLTLCAERWPARGRTTQTGSDVTWRHTGSSPTKWRSPPPTCSYR